MTQQAVLDIDGVHIILDAPDTHTDQLNRIAGHLRAMPKQVPSDRDLERIDPAFRELVQLCLARCEAKGHTFRPFYTVRSPVQQAKLWRQSRPTREIQVAIRKLQSEGALFLAEILKTVGPQHGRWTTNALPGQSWHQWGLAVDCFLLSGEGRAIWSSNHPGYEIYATEARELGMSAGYWWRRKDSVHLQAKSDTVRAAYTWPQIDSAMAERFQEG